jgi:hypothetical protein
MVRCFKHFVGLAVFSAALATPAAATVIQASPMEQASVWSLIPRNDVFGTFGSGSLPSFRFGQSHVVPPSRPLGRLIIPLNSILQFVWLW